MIVAMSENPASSPAQQDAKPEKPVTPLWPGDTRTSDPPPERKT